MAPNEISATAPTQKTDARTVLGWIAGGLWLFGYVPYWLGLWGYNLQLERITPTQPEKATWWIFFLLDAIVLAGMYKKKTINWQIIIATAMAFLLGLYACFWGVPGWTDLDTFCVVSAGIGVLLWKQNDEPNWGILLCTIAMVVGVIPTIVSVWNDPSHETFYGWFFGFLSCVLQLAAVRKISIATLTQPIGFFVIEASVVLALVVKGATPW